VFSEIYTQKASKKNIKCWLFFSRKLKHDAKFNIDLSSQHQRASTTNQDQILNTKHWYADFCRLQPAAEVLLQKVEPIAAGAMDPHHRGQEMRMPGL